MAQNLGIIADDLTGSLDTGVQFSKWGLTSLVSLRGHPAPETACVIMNTDSRAVPPDVAAERVGRAARLLRGRLVYKKIDSTLRGNLGAEITAAMQELGMKKAVVVPALPANGRTTLGGRLFIRGVPLDQTGFARDPRNAIDESHIPTLLQQHTGRHVGSVDIDIVEQGTEAIREAIARCPEGFVVVDVEIQKHLADIALAVIQAKEAWLPVGSAGLAEELPAALARGQLKHLNELNATRIRNSEYLSRELSKIPGVIPPHCPPDYKHVYWFYAVRFDPQAAGVDTDPKRFRIAIEKALFKEGVLVGQWQTMPVLAQDLFQSMIGVGDRYPWAINEAKGVTYKYDVKDYPVAQMLCDSYTNVHSIHPPNGLELNEKIVAGFHKVFDNLDEVMDHADDDVKPGFDGPLYGVG